MSEEAKNWPYLPEDVHGIVCELLDIYYSQVEYVDKDGRTKKKRHDPYVFESEFKSNPHFLLKRAQTYGIVVFSPGQSKYHPDTTKPSRNRFTRWLTGNYKDPRRTAKQAKRYMNRCQLDICDPAWFPMPEVAQQSERFRQALKEKK